VWVEDEAWKLTPEVMAVLGLEEALQIVRVIRLEEWRSIPTLVIPVEVASSTQRPVVRLVAEEVGRELPVLQETLQEAETEGSENWSPLLMASHNIMVVVAEEVLRVQITRVLEVWVEEAAQPTIVQEEMEPPTLEAEEAEEVMNREQGELEAVEL
jgi:hypothetical protein